MMGFKTALKVALVVIAAIVILAVSCPDEDSFDRWAEKTLGNESESILKEAQGKALATQAKWTADYEDHFLWATVDAYQGSTERRYVGVLGTWIQVSGE